MPAKLLRSSEETGFDKLETFLKTHYKITDNGVERKAPEEVALVEAAIAEIRNVNNKYEDINNTTVSEEDIEKITSATRAIREALSSLASQTNSSEQKSDYQLIIKDVMNSLSYPVAELLRNKLKSQMLELKGEVKTQYKTTHTPHYQAYVDKNWNNHWDKFYQSYVENFLKSEEQDFIKKHEEQLYLRYNQEQAEAFFLTRTDITDPQERQRVFDAGFKDWAAENKYRYGFKDPDVSTLLPKIQTEYGTYFTEQYQQYCKETIETYEMDQKVKSIGDTEGFKSRLASMQTSLGELSDKLVPPKLSRFSLFLGNKKKQQQEQQQLAHTTCDALIATIDTTLSALKTMQSSDGLSKEKIDGLTIFVNTGPQLLGQILAYNTNTAARDLMIEKCPEMFSLLEEIKLEFQTASLGVEIKALQDMQTTLNSPEVQKGNALIDELDIPDDIVVPDGVVANDDGVVADDEVVADDTPSYRG